MTRKQLAEVVRRLECRDIKAKWKPLRGVVEATSFAPFLRPCDFYSETNLGAYGVSLACVMTDIGAYVIWDSQTRMTVHAADGRQWPELAALHLLADAGATRRRELAQCLN